MHVDIGNALDAVADPGLSRATLDALDERVVGAHDTIAAGRDASAFGYAALNLPDETDTAVFDEITATWPDPAVVLTVGIGGSALGAATITDSLETDGGAYYLDNVDPEHVTALLETLPLQDTVVNVVSRSGTTAETLANFLVVRDAMTSAGVDWTERTFVTTGTDGPLADLAAAEDLPTLPVPDGVPGRFAALSTVGLAAPALLGVDIDAILDGAAGVANGLSGSLFECAPYAYGAVNYALADRGANVSVMMPYAESLETFAEWFAQLWAESLGKDGVGQTPARALGVTDQHSQLQLYRAGPRDKLVTLVRPTERDDRDIPPTDIDALTYLGESTLGDLMDAEFEATEASLAHAGVPNVRIELDAIDAESVGELLYAMEAACILVGELLDVDTFTQPAVEWGKNAARGLLGDTTTPEADAVTDKHRFVVE